jgi:hypothetical protein
MADLVTIATFAAPWEAHILRGRLESEDIPAFVVDENMMLTAQVPCVRLQVRSEDAKRALEIKRGA